MRVDVFRAKQAAERAIKDAGATLEPEDARLVEKSLLDGKQNGLALPDKEREELMKLKKELAETCSTFSVSCFCFSYSNFSV
jgi:Zn-dependent oligopeptidase